MKVYFNGEYIGAENLGSKLNPTRSVYEVIRVRDGRPQFLMPHLERLEKSYEMVDFKAECAGGFPGIKSIEKTVFQIIKLNNIENQNIRIDLGPDVFVVKPNPSSYPAESVYKEGVSAGSADYLRPDPEAKVMNPDLNKMAQDLREKNGWFEVILVHSGIISEGARSNIFFIGGDKLYTSPDSAVLGGITKAMTEKHSPYEIVKRPIKLAEITEFDGCFLTGTSIDLLPIKTFDGHVFDTAKNAVYQKLIEDFRKLI